MGLIGIDLKKYGARQQFTKIAQFYQLVGSGLILTKHIFKGLNRPLFCDGNIDGDQNKLIYARKPARDYEWAGGREGGPVRKEAPVDCVFITVISPNNHRDSYSGVYGWVNNWAWVEEDQFLDEAPMGWVDRFDKKIWTRGVL